MVTFEQDPDENEPALVGEEAAGAEALKRGHVRHIQSTAGSLGGAREEESGR